jgi:F-type H+-transporting ATPase subunit b
MTQLLAAFGIDWRLLVINLINFGVLLWALWYFLYGPLTRMLDERRARVIQGVRDAEEAERHLQEVRESREGFLAQAGKEADTVVSNARTAAAAKERAVAAAAEAAAIRTLDEAKQEADAMKIRAMEESKKEVAKLVVLGMERLAVEKGK